MYFFGLVRGFTVDLFPDAVCHELSKVTFAQDKHT